MRGDPDLVASLPPSQSAVNLGAVAPIRESVKDWASERARGNESIFDTQGASGHRGGGGQ